MKSNRTCSQWNIPNVGRSENDDSEHDLGTHGRNTNEKGR